MIGSGVENMVGFDFLIMVGSGSSFQHMVGSESAWQSLCFSLRAEPDSDFSRRSDPVKIQPDPQPLLQFNVEGIQNIYTIGKYELFCRFYMHTVAMQA